MRYVTVKGIMSPTSSYQVQKDGGGVKIFLNGCYLAGTLPEGVSLGSIHLGCKLENSLCFASTFDVSIHLPPPLVLNSKQHLKDVFPPCKHKLDHHNHSWSSYF